MLLYIAPINSWGFGGKQHDEITTSAFPFLKSDILGQVVKGVLSQDEGLTDFSTAGLKGENHFDACMFGESVDNTNAKYESLLKLSPSQAAWSFGELLHPVQDFYSHSNWVEIGKDRIVENGWGYWPTFLGWKSLMSSDDVLVVQGDLPNGWSMTSDIVPVITSPSFQDPKKGLFTHGREFYRLGDDCPDELQDWNHVQLNKDDPNPDEYAGDLGKYSGFHIKAKSLAVSQTAHEWCRLLDLVELFQGPSGAKKLFDAWVEKPIDALSGCPTSSLYKDVAPDAVDTNGDGIPDSSSGGSEPAVPADTNFDGIPDAVDTNGDGIPDSSSGGSEPAVPADTNFDGIPDAVDTNGDGIPDSSISQPEPGSDSSSSDAVDTNGDGIPDSSSGVSQGPDTSNPLYQSQQYNCDPNSVTVQINTKGDKVLELQTYLTDLGYGDLIGTEKNDGEFGPNTENSVMTYQKDFGLSVDGKVGTQTWGSLCEKISLLPKTFPTNNIPES